MEGGKKGIKGTKGKGTKPTPNSADPGGQSSGTEGLDYGPINNLMGSAETATNMIGLYLKLKIIGIIVALFVVVTIVFYVYFTYFHSKRIRWFNMSIMIYLEPEIQFFSDKIATFISEYNRNTVHKFDYDDPSISSNLYFFETIGDSGIKNGMNDINNLLAGNDVMYKSETHDVYHENVVRFVNTRFNWSSSDKMERIHSNLLRNDEFFGKLEEIAVHQTDFETMLNTHSIFNFLDLQHMTVEDLDKNKLFRKYGKFLSGNEGLMKLVTPVREKMVGSHARNVDILDAQISNFPAFFGPAEDNKTVDTAIADLLSAIKNILIQVFADFHNIPPETFRDSVEERTLPESKCKLPENGENASGSPPSVEDQELLSKHVRMTKMLDEIVEFYNANINLGSELIAFFKDHYIYVEKIAYEQFHPDTHKSLFSANEANTIVTYYQTAIDYIYLKAYPSYIEAAIKFTLFYMLDTRREKDQRLDQLCELYMAFFDVFVTKEYRRRLDAYDNSRKPDLKKLEKLYMDSLTNYWNYYVIKCTLNQWEKLFTGHRPPKYRWTLDWLREILANKSIEDIMYMIFPDMNNKATGVIDNVFSGLDEIKNSVGKYTKWVNPMTYIKKIPVIGGFLGGGMDMMKKMAEYAIKFMKAMLKLTMYMLTIITKPAKLLEFLGRALIFVAAIIVKMIMYLIKLKDVYLLGEFLCYIVVLLFFTVFNLALWVVLSVFTFVIMILDLKIFKGWIYRYLYWAFGASENSPRAWYMRSGHHYGFDSCAEGVACNNRYQNKVKRMFFAYQPCGDSYKPDRQFYGLTCARKYFQEPSYCLQANINRMRENMSSYSPYVPGTFIPDTTYFDAPRAKRIKITNNFKDMKRKFYGNCASAMDPYDALTKNVCRMYPEITPYSKHGSIEKLCNAAYCTNGKNEPFCYKFTGDVSLYNDNTPGNGKNLYKRMLVITIYITILVYIIQTFVAKNKVV